MERKGARDAGRAAQRVDAGASAAGAERRERRGEPRPGLIHIEGGVAAGGGQRRLHGRDLGRRAAGVERQHDGQRAAVFRPVAPLRAQEPVEIDETLDRARRGASQRREIGERLGLGLRQRLVEVAGFRVGKRGRRLRRAAGAQSRSRICAAALRFAAISPICSGAPIHLSTFLAKSPSRAGRIEGDETDIAAPRAGHAPAREVRAPARAAARRDCRARR